MAYGMRAMCTTTWPHAWGKSKGVTHALMCHHHLIPHQFEWEKNLVDEIEKERKRKEIRRREKEGKACVGRGEETRIGGREK